MVCKENCCGSLYFKQSCIICRSIAFAVKVLDWRNHITLQPMTLDDFKRYHAPVFQGDEGSFVIGFLPVAKRIFWELFLPSNTKYEIHGDHLIIKHPNVPENSCCYECRCPQSKHCQYCKANEKVIKSSIEVLA